MVEEDKNGSSKVGGGFFRRPGKDDEDKGGPPSSRQKITPFRRSPLGPGSLPWSYEEEGEEKEEDDKL